MKRSKTKILSFRVPVELADKVDTHVKTMQDSSRQKLLTTILIPALNRLVKREEQKQAA